MPTLWVHQPPPPIFFFKVSCSLQDSKLQVSKFVNCLTISVSSDHIREAQASDLLTEISDPPKEKVNMTGQPLTDSGPTTAPACLHKWGSSQGSLCACEEEWKTAHIIEACILEKNQKYVSSIIQQMRSHFFALKASQK